MIRYRKGGALRLLRHTAPDPPFWAAGTAIPYEGHRSTPIALDWVNLIASGVEQDEVEIAEGAGQTMTLSPYLRAPLVIDASGPAEAVYRRGEEVVHAGLELGIELMELITTDGALPSMGNERLTVGIGAWPPDPAALEQLAIDAQRRSLSWGVLVPVIPPATTGIQLLEQIADIAAGHGATFLAAVPMEVEPTARRILAERLQLDEEEFAGLFESDLEQVTVGTERHVAALAAERGLLDAVPVLLPPRHINWMAAAALGSIGNRMIRMNREVELGWAILRASRTIAALGKPIRRIADAASLAIIEPLDPIVAGALEEWLERGTCGLMVEVDTAWRLRRDYGVE